MILKPPKFILPVRGHPLSRGLAAYWLLNEGSGNKVFDLSGNGNAGTFVNTPTWVGGKFGSAINLDSSGSDYILISDSPELSPDYLTMGIWVYPHDNTGVRLFSKTWDDGAAVSPFYQYQLYLSGGSISYFYCTIGGTLYSASGPAVPANQWSFIVGRYDGVNLSCWVNGVPGNNTAAAGVVSPRISSITIGRRGLGYSSPEYYDGLLDLPFIYNRALTARELAELYFRPFAMFDRMPIELWVGATSVGVPPVGMAGAMTTNTGYWGW